MPRSSHLPRPALVSPTSTLNATQTTHPLAKTPTTKSFPPIAPGWINESTFNRDRLERYGMAGRVLDFLMRAMAVSAAPGLYLTVTASPSYQS